MTTCRPATLAVLLAVVALAPVSVPPALAAPKPAREQTAPHPPVTLDDLFARLKQADDPAEAKAVATLIERRFARSGSATADLLTDRAREAMAGDDVPLAVELMDRVTTLEPGWSEGWNRRATLFWRLSDSATAIANVERALVLEPRHFEAWAALGKLYLAADDKRRALDAFRRAEAIYPRWDEVRTAIERLTPDVDGRDL